MIYFYLIIAYVIGFALTFFILSRKSGKTKADRVMTTIFSIFWPLSLLLIIAILKFDK